MVSMMLPIVRVLMVSMMLLMRTVTVAKVDRNDDHDHVEGEAGMEAFIEFVPRPTQQLETYLACQPD